MAFETECETIYQVGWAGTIPIPGGWRVAALVKQGQRYILTLRCFGTAAQEREGFDMLARTGLPSVTTRVVGPSAE